MIDRYNALCADHYLSSYFLVDYTGQGAKAPLNGAYSYSLAHMLKDAGYAPSSLSAVEVWRHLGLFFKGKKVLELGCRNGGFLNFALNHGASQVAGNTDAKRAKNARRNVGKNGVIAITSAEGAGLHSSLASFEPDIIVSVNLLDKKRPKASRPSKEEILTSIFRLATSRTRVYLAPSVDNPVESAPTFSESDLQRGEVKGLQHEIIMRGAEPVHLFSFRVNKRAVER